ncbi:GntR family transcriptional regulator [Fictibacillus enclensis]|uniref:GntR family transcriptional regulator n=1 Tax=Fictibacillus enclensis TaxID=1017270 RepID=UPI0025A12BC0|nr:GntR family transcriptional regulator [Fictibacillus enclensis]MDM5340529.1 GntR family transcriptional regulator [Fictibacillus enclensis]
MNTNKTIKVSMIHTEVYKHLRYLITSGKILPGDKITLREIAEKFGVSTMPVREAVRRLQAEGFLTFDRRSVTVRELSLKEVDQIFIIRQRLETLAAEWALPNVTQKDIKILRELAKKMDDKNILYDEWEELNREFHLYFYNLSMSESLNQLIKNVWDSVTPYMNIFSSSVSSFVSSQEQHHLMIKLIEHKKIEELTILLTKHLDETRDTIVDVLKNS